VVGAADLPGHGRGREGRGHQARDVGPEPAGLPGGLLQGALQRGDWITTTCGAASGTCRSAGRIGIFNRSYYEETLVVRVHPELLGKQKLHPSLVSKHIWKERFKDIRAFERYLTRNGTIVRKFFLNVSRKEQKKRFLERIETPEKNWKFSAADVKERAYWKDYMAAYEDMIRHTATGESPWYVVPADNKWFTRIVVAAAVIEALAGLDLHYPTVSAEQRRDLETARKTLLAE
jgi:hypothetical protein